MSTILMITANATRHIAVSVVHEPAKGALVVRSYHKENVVQVGRGAADWMSGAKSVEVTESGTVLYDDDKVSIVRGSWVGSAIRKPNGDFAVSKGGELLLNQHPRQKQLTTLMRMVGLKGADAEHAAITKHAVISELAKGHAVYVMSNQQPEKVLRGWFDEGFNRESMYLKKAVQEANEPEVEDDRLPLPTGMYYDEQRGEVFDYAPSYPEIPADIQDEIERTDRELAETAPVETKKARKPRRKTTKIGKETKRVAREGFGL